MSSPLALDSRGRRIAIVTSASPGLNVGDRFLVLGNAAHAAEDGIYFLEAETSPGRPNGVTEPRRTNRDPLPIEPALKSAIPRTAQP